MKYGRTKSRLVAGGLSTILATVATPAAAFAVTLAGVQPIAQAAPAKQAACRVHAVLASKEGDGKLPKSLEFLRETLAEDQFAAYKSFHLVDKKTLKLEADKPSNTSFSSGHKMALDLLGGDEERLKLHLDLTGRDGKESLISTDYSIADNGLFMIGGGNFKQGEVVGKLFFAIQCARR